MHVEQRGELDAIEVFVLREAHFVIHVAVDGIWEPGVGKLDQVLIVDGPVNAVLTHGEGDDGHLPAIRREPGVGCADDRQGDSGGVFGGKSRFEEPVRGDGEFQLPEIGVGNAVEI